MVPPLADVLILLIGTEPFAIERVRTLGSLSAAALEPLRRAPNGVAGLIDTGERRVPVVDLHWRFGAPSPLRTSSCVVLLLRDIAAGLLVSSVEGIVRADLSPAGMMLAFGRMGYVRGVLALPGGPVPLVEPALLIPASLLRAASA